MNRGHGPSLRRGLAVSGGEWIFLVDSDRQFAADEFWKLRDRREEADLVLGLRRPRPDARHRIVLSVVVSLVVSVLAGRRIRDPNVPFRLIRRRLWQELAPEIGEDVRAPSILIALGAAVRRARIVEVEVTHLPREHGPSSLRPLKLIRFSLGGLVELFAFRFRIRAQETMIETAPPAA